MGKEAEGHLGVGVPQDIQPASTEGQPEITEPEEFARIREAILEQWRGLLEDKQTPVLVALKRRFMRQK
jgi:hypothetical protein